MSKYHWLVSRFFSIRQDEKSINHPKFLAFLPLWDDTLVSTFRLHSSFRGSFIPARQMLCTLRFHRKPRVKIHISIENQVRSISPLRDGDDAEWNEKPPSDFYGIVSSESISKIISFFLRTENPLFLVDFIVFIFRKTFLSLLLSLMQSHGCFRGFTAYFEISFPSKGRELRGSVRFSFRYGVCQLDRIMEFGSFSMEFRIWGFIKG